MVDNFILFFFKKREIFHKIQHATMALKTLSKETKDDKIKAGCTKETKREIPKLTL